MVKIGILSMQKVKNHGSYLQAYALMSFLKNNFNCEVKFVDFETKNGVKDTCRESYTQLKSKKLKYSIIRFLAFLTKIPLIGKVVLKNKKIAEWKNLIAFFDLYCNKFEKVFWKHLPLSNITLAQTKDIDILIIGSDEVFNISINDTVGYSHELFAVGSDAKKNLSFAGSFGCTTIKDLNEQGRRERVSGYFARFDGISVRDKNSLNIVKELLGQHQEVGYHLDPVFHYDFKKELVAVHRKKPYLILYAYNGLQDQQKAHIMEYARNHGLEILCCLGYQKDLGEFMNISPFEVLSYVRNAQCVVTTTFHGCVFAIKYNKPFCVLTQKKTDYGNEEKVGDLLERLHLTGRIINNFCDLEQKMQEDINYNEVNELISILIENAKHYLGKHITE